MLIQKPEYIVTDKLSENVHPKFIYGYKGWLFLITGIFLLLAFYRIKFTYSNTEAVFHLVPSNEKYVFWLWLSVGILNAFLPLCIAFVLYFNRLHSILIAKVCLILLPLAAFAGLLFTNIYQLDYMGSFQRGLLPTFVFISLPVFLYLIFSRRVKNTFLFNGSSLPQKFKCPYCLSFVNPNERERVEKEIVCANCNNLISKTTLLANVTRIHTKPRKKPG